MRIKPTQSRSLSDVNHFVYQCRKLLFTVIFQNYKLQSLFVCRRFIRNQFHYRYFYFDAVYTTSAMTQPARRTFLPGHVVVIICSITIQTLNLARTISFGA